jgi:RNA polymerase sigma factor (sigma-70 family)
VTPAQLYEQNTALVWSVIRQSRLTPPRGFDDDDLFAVGARGLWRAAQRFDASRGLRFSTMAHPYIRHEIRDFVATMGRQAGPLACPLTEEIMESVPAPPDDLESVLLYAALRKVKPEHLAPLLLCYRDGWGWREAAARLGMEVWHVNYRLQQGKAAAREALVGW